MICFSLSLSYFLCSLKIGTSRGHHSGPVLRDTARLSQRYPPIARYGVFGVSTWPIGCDTPSPFSERFPPWRTSEVEVRYPPLKRGISAILARYLMKTRQMGAIPPSAILSRKGIARYGGGISHWAAKGANSNVQKRVGIFSLRVGLCCLRLVFVAYGQLAWSSLLYG